jgi:glycosyltransferase involved in cell wall biosynthesis
LRILYFADIRFPIERANGIQTMETCHALARRGHFVSLVVRPDTESPSRDPFGYYGLPLIARFSIETVPLSGPAVARRAGYIAFAAGRILGRSRADIVMTRDLGVASALLRIPKRLRPAIVYESHGYAPDVAAALPGLVATAKPAAPGKLERLARREAFVWRSAEGYVTITHGLAAELRERFGERPHLSVVPDGTRVASADRAQSPESRVPNSESRVPNSESRAPSPESRVPSPEPRVSAVKAQVTYAGHLYAWKGVDVLLEALARLEGVRGVIVGGHEREPDLGRLRELAKSLGIADRVRFTGLVTPPEVAAHLREADALVLPNPASAISTRFTSPLKLFEYMAAGRPIVASDLPAIREVLRHEQNALLVAPGDPDALAAAVRRLLDDRALADRLARAAHEAAGEYSWDKRAERLEALFQPVRQAQGGMIHSTR